MACFHAKRRLWTQRAFNRLFIRPIINLYFYSIHSSRIDSSGYYLVIIWFLYHCQWCWMKHFCFYTTCTTVFHWHSSLCLNTLQKMWKLFSEMSTLLFHVIPEKHIKFKKYNFKSLLYLTKYDTNIQLLQIDNSSSFSPWTVGTAKGHWSKFDNFYIATSVGQYPALHCTVW